MPNKLSEMIAALVHRRIHRRRKVLNIGGAKVQNIGGGGANFSLAVN